MEEVRKARTWPNMKLSVFLESFLCVMQMYFGKLAGWIKLPVVVILHNSFLFYCLYCHMLYLFND